MAAPSRSRNFFGALVDRVLPGSNYNRATGQYSNIGSGLAGLGVSLGAGLLGGPGASMLARQGAEKLISGGGLFGGGQPGGVQPEAIGGIPGVQAGNLGFGAPQPMQAPSMGFQSAGFGNYTLPGAMPAQSQPWQPQSAWGAQVASQPASPSPFSPASPQAQAAAMQMSAPTATQGADSAFNQGSLFLGNMDRMNSLARNAMSRKVIQ